MDFKKRRGKLSGLSAPYVGGGLQWTPGTKEEEVIRSLVIDIDARRALYADFEAEGEGWVSQSVRTMRDRMSEALRDLVDGSEATLLVRSLRDDCNRFLSRVRDADETMFTPLRPHAQKALQELRESFRVKMAHLGQGGVEQATALAQRIPTEVLMRSPLGEEQQAIYVQPPPDERR